MGMTVQTSSKLRSTWSPVWANLWSRDWETSGQQNRSNDRFCLRLGEPIDKGIGVPGLETVLCHRAGEEDRRRDDLQADFHRFDRGRQMADAAMRRDDEEAVAGIGRQRAVSSS